MRSGAGFQKKLQSQKKNRAAHAYSRRARGALLKKILLGGTHVIEPGVEQRVGQAVERGIEAVELQDATAQRESELVVVAARGGPPSVRRWVSLGEG
jgi:hypothetical protein